MNAFQQLCVYVYLASRALFVFGTLLHLSRFEHDISLDGFVYKDQHFIINNTNASSVFECASKCHEYNPCAGFCFTSKTQDCQIQKSRIEKGGSELSIRHGTQCFYKNTVGQAHVENDVSSLPSTTTIPLHGSTEVAKAEGNFTCPVNNKYWGEVFYPGGYFYQYKVFTDKDRTQAEAVTKCQEFGAFLPVFTTKAKLLYFVQNILTGCAGVDGNDFWADGDNRLDGTFKTHNNLGIPQNLGSKSPNNSSNENCVQMTKQHHYMLSPSTCDHNGVKTVCEKK